ncbi:MAG: class I SAM-dependent methyltransferase [Candidatus Dojkabacteria bacterium]|jgi:cyclopropane fatty-acyl-phospholipid synthase-like methyltransferase|nr:class I SAM-dependent methyltransferase [Candidatus Dojkabacteria bacterium]
MNIFKNFLNHYKSKREWSEGLGSEVVYLVKILKEENKLGTVLDCGAGEGRHSIYLAKEGAQRVVAVESDSEQVDTIKQKKEKFGLGTLELVEVDVVEYLEALEDSPFDAMIDSGLSHCLVDQVQRKRYFELIRGKLKKGGLYSITHFSENEVLSQTHFKTDLPGLKKLFSSQYWRPELDWQEENWARKDGKKHFAYKAVLRRI